MNVRYTFLWVALAVFLLGPGQRVEAQGLNATSLKVLMIQAQNDSAPIDSRLENIEYKLRRIFGFQFYAYLGEGSITLARGGSGVIDLPDGHRLHVRVGSKGGKVEVNWVKENTSLLSTSVTISRKSPVVLGGIPSNGGKLILVLTKE